MAKRSWTDANVAYGDQGLTSSGQDGPLANNLIADHNAATGDASGPNVLANTNEPFSKFGRKSKACAACRKHKVRACMPTSL